MNLKQAVIATLFFVVTLVGSGHLANIRAKNAHLEGKFEACQRIMVGMNDLFATLIIPQTGFQCVRETEEVFVTFQGKKFTLEGNPANQHESCLT